MSICLCVPAYVSSSGDVLIMVTALSTPLHMSTTEQQVPLGQKEPNGS